MSDTRKTAYEKLNSFLKQSLWPLAYADYLRSLDALYASEFSDPAFQQITEKTLADVQAGIPARDAEIEALRKENAELREQLEAIGAGGVSGKLMPGKSQQPVSGDDVAPKSVADALELMDAILAPECGLLAVPYTSATVTAAREDLALIRAALAQQDADKEKS